MESNTSSRSSRGFSLNLTPLDNSNENMTSSFETSPYIPHHAYSKHTYLAHKSAPSTPGILSHHHSSRHSSARLTSLTPLTSTHKSYADLPHSARSSTNLPNSARSRRQQKGSSKLHDQDSEWLFRAGAAIASEVGESKGQAWLSQRASSTSLAGMTGVESSDSEEEIDMRQSNGLWDGRGIERGVTPWELRRRRLEMDARSRSRVNSARASRVGSRAGSTRASRRNSGVGAEGLGMSGRITTGSKDEGREEDYFGVAKVASEEEDVEDAVDAIHAEEDEGMDDEEDDEEVARLMKDKGFGLGSVVGQVLTWTGLAGAESNSHGGLESQGSTSKALNMGEAVPANAKRVEAQALDIEPASAEGSFKDDIVWLLGVAGKILF